MNKCEHGEKITMFCASDCCVWKEAAGCELCIKKYHNHMGPTVFLSEEQVGSLVKKYALDSSIKPKCRILQQAIFSYFTLIKTQLSSSMDVICKNIINQIGYPYLYSNNTLSTYKRLKNKEYKKLVQKDFKVLYQLSQKLNEKQLAREEAKIYMSEMKNTQQLLNNLEDLLKRYETIAKTSQPTFLHDSSYIFKINEVIQTLRTETQSPTKSSKQKDTKESSEKNKNLRQSTSTQRQSVQVNNFMSEFQKQKPSKTQSRESSQMSFPTRLSNIATPNAVGRDKHRQVSIDKKILKQHKFGSAKQSKQAANFESEDVKTQKLSQQLSTRQAELNERKRLLIEMMKQKEENSKSQKQKPKEDMEQTTKAQSVSSKTSGFSERFRTSREGSQAESLLTKEYNDKLNKLLEKDNQFKNRFAKTITIESSETHNNQEDDSDKKIYYQDKQETHQAFTNLPIIEKLAVITEDIREVKKKMIVIPKPEQLNEIQNNQSMLGQSQSPILKKINIETQNKLKESMVGSKEENKSKQLKADSPVLKKLEVTQPKSNEVLQLKENEQKSLALLLKSLALNAQEAISYLQKSLEHADNNLSAAEYLTYLYLQLNRPQDCLYLCNKMLQKIQNSADPEELSLIINNNKAASLNILGRYSQSIVILEKCLKCREKDYFYKNLGDAYFSVSIYEKAVYNYEKALRLNECYDEAQYNLAVCLFVQENYFNAKLSIKKALEQEPSNEDYLELLQNIQTRINNC